MKAQSSTEAAMLMTFMVFTMVIFLGVTSSKLSETYEKKDKQFLEDLGYVIETELKTASAAENGYYRVVELPVSLEGRSYTAEMFGPEKLEPTPPYAEHTEIILKYADNYLPTYEYVIVIPKTVNGTFCAGDNVVLKEKNQVNTTCNCITGYRDSDGDTYTVGNGTIFCKQLSPPPGYRATRSSADDCNDNNPAIGACKHVFVTSTVYTGNLERLNGADSKCQQRATAAGLGGTWKAWLSDSSTDAKDRMTPSTYQYILVDDATMIANNFNQIIDGAIDAPINLDENKAAVSAQVWTGTNENGIKSPQYCTLQPPGTDWADGSQGQGRVGSTTETGVQWTRTNPASCTSSLRLYCFQQ